MTIKSTVNGLLCFLFVACGAVPADVGDELDGDTDPVVALAGADEKGDSASVSFRVVGNFALPPSVGAHETRRLFKSATSFRDYFKNGPVDIDFSREWAVFYGAGQQPTGGFSARVISVRVAGKTLKVTTALESPGPNCVVTQATTKPFVIVAFPKQRTTYTRYSRADKTVDCATPEPATETYDGVAFTATEGARALAAANDANLDALSSVGIFGTQARIITTERPFQSLAYLALHAGIGNGTMRALKKLGQAYENVSAFVVTAQNVGPLADQVKQFIMDDDSWRENLDDLLGDFTSDTDRIQKIAEAVIKVILDGINADALADVGARWSSEAAAKDPWLQSARARQRRALADYPRGLLEFIPALTVADKLARAQRGLLYYWQWTFVYTPEWQAAFNNKVWTDVAARVQADVASFSASGGYRVVPRDNASTFVGTAYGLYVEVDVDDVGKVTRVYIEID